MKVYEIGTGYTSIPPRISAATEAVIDALANAFADKNVDVQVFDIKAEDRIDRGFPVHEVKLPGFLRGTDIRLGLKHKVRRVIYSIMLACALKKNIRKSDCKVVVHFHNQYNLFFFLKIASRKIREKALIAYTNHSGIWSMDWAKTESIIRKRYFQEVYCMKNADIVFALNASMKKNICDHVAIPADKIHLIANGVNTEVFYPMSDIEIRKEKDSRKLSGKKIILQVGSVCENKGQLRVLKWIAPFLRKNTDVVFIYAGGIVSEKYQEQIRQTARDEGLSGRVVYLGMLAPGEELNKIYNIADITVTASDYEAFPLVTLESLASGTPVLINDAVSLRDGRGCMKYTPDNLNRVLEGALFEDKGKAKLGPEARKYILEYYDWTNVADQYLTAMRDALMFNEV